MNIEQVMDLCICIPLFLNSDIKIEILKKGTQPVPCTR